MIPKWTLALILFLYILTSTRCMKVTSKKTTKIEKRNSSISSNNNIKCSDTEEFEECLNNLKPVKDKKGFATNLQGIQQTCKIFNSGVDCINRWSSQCLPGHENVLDSVLHGLETYHFLCTNPGFQQNISSQNEKCFGKIFHHWDKCAGRYLEGLRSLNDRSHILSVCCIRIRFFRCVNKIGNHFCPGEVDFLQNLAQVSVRTEKANYNPPHCKSVTDTFCSSIKIPTLSVAERAESINFFFQLVLFLFISFNNI